MNIVLIGFKNSGKTTIGKALAEKLNQRFIDTDELLETYFYEQKSHWLSPKEIIQLRGEEYFRQIEKESVLQFLKIYEAKLFAESIVIATGGGAILEKDNIHIFKKLGSLIYLNTAYETLCHRNQVNPSLFDFEKVYHSRKNIYPQIADREILTDNKSIPEIIEEIINGE